MRTQVWWTRAFPLSLLLGLGACAQRPAGPPAFPPLPVQLQVVTLQPLQEVTDYIGRLESRKSVVLKPKQEGQVTAIAVQPGQGVKAGATLVQLEPDRQQAVVTNSQALVAANQANVQTARQTL
ncbi:MAG: biotin/lipoyl-binding protein, partial [Gloeomargaritaceae cyanobacterium C42_A2020_066]|nr:biotin/lipoyl-binding protein [Gloeomargaritaceae cyanobacterium C42_A2020_066]